jgi:hypothetical protein
VFITKKGMADVVAFFYFLFEKKKTKAMVVIFFFGPFAAKKVSSELTIDNNLMIFFNI